MYALTIFQFQLLARIDDRTQVLVENIRVHDSFFNALKTRLNWSKNVTEERDAPWQIILGSGVTLTRYFCRMFSAFATTTQFLQVERSQRRQRTICVPRFRMEALLVLKVVVLLQRAWGVTLFEHLQQHMHVVWDAQKKMTKTLVVAGNQRLVSQMCTKIPSCHFRMQKLRRNCVSVGRAFIRFPMS